MRINRKQRINLPKNFKSGQHFGHCNSQTCSRCNKRHPVKLGKSDRIFICAFCGLVLDRDVNSARDILYKAQITEFGTNFVKQAHASP